LVLVVCVGMLLPIVHAVRWKVILEALGSHLTAAEAADLTVTSALMNYASPGFVGASAKAILARRSKEVKYEDSAASIAFEYGLDLFLLVVGSIIAVLLLGPATFSPLLRWDTDLPSGLVIAIVVAGIVAVVVLAWKLGAWNFVRRLMRAFLTLGKDVDHVVIALLTLLYWLLQVIVVVLLFWALHIDIDLANALAVATLPLLAGMLAPVPGGIGAREAVTVALAAATNIGAAQLLSLAVLQRVLLVGALPLALLAVRGARRAMAWRHA
jgi:uncharacterized membrane protein YbhN (UPF0104 family)